MRTHQHLPFLKCKGESTMAAIRIRHSIRSVPYGHVVTRDELALMAYGHSGQGALIQVNKYLKELPTSERSTPWHRVLGKTAGKLTLQDGREKKQETLLLKEHPSGVPKQLNRDPKELPQFLAEVFETVEIAPSKHTHTMIYLHGSSPINMIKIWCKILHHLKW